MNVTFSLKSMNIIIDENDTTTYETFNSLLTEITKSYMKSPLETFIFKFQENQSHYKELMLLNDIIRLSKNGNLQFTEAFKRSAIIENIIFDNTDNKQSKLQNKLIEINEKVDKKLFADLYDLECNNNPIMNDVIKIKSLDIYDLKSYINSYAAYKKIKYNEKMYYNWVNGKLETPFTKCSHFARLNNFNFDGEILNFLEIPNNVPLFLFIWCINRGADINDYDFSEWGSLVKNGYNKNFRSKFYGEVRNKLDRLKDSYGEDIFDETLNIYTKKTRGNYSYDEAIREFNSWVFNPDKTDDDNIIDGLFKYNLTTLYDIIITEKNLYSELIKLETDIFINKLIFKLYSNIPDIKILIADNKIYFQEKFMLDANNIWQKETKELYDKIPSNPDNDDYLNDDGMVDLNKDIAFYRKKPIPIKKERRKISQEDKDFLDSL